MKIAVASGKGGTGKTTLSSNLANFLAKDFSVLLTDLDVEEPNAKIFFSGTEKMKEEKYKMIPVWDESKCTLCNICQESCNFNAILKLGNTINVFPELCHSCYACSELCPTSALPMSQKKIGELKYFENEKISFIEAKLSIGEEQAVPLIKQTNDFIKENFKNHQIYIYDSPPGTSCPVIETTKNVDLIILVTEPTPFGFHDLKLAVDTMEELDKEFAVVINKYGIGNNDVENYCKSNGIDIIAKIPNDKKIAELYSNGKLLFENIPEVKNELEKIRKYILKLMNEK